VKKKTESCFQNVNK